MSISIQSISKLYGRQRALDQVSLEVRPGEVVGLLGPNGAGKSTLMKILTCYLTPDEGTANVCGFSIAGQSLDVRKVTGYLPENNPLYTELYIREFLHFIAGARKVANRETRIREVIEMTGLGPESHKKIGALSRGYRQRVGLAQALLHDPEVLILDEPTSGLDPNQLADIRNLIKTIGRKKTVMLSTHIMQEVEAVCDRVVIIHNGRIAADGATRDLRLNTGIRQTVRVEFNAPADPAMLRKIKGVSDVLKHPSGQWILTATSGHDIRPEIARFSHEKNLLILSMNADEQKLEEIFQELTRK